MVSVSFDRLFDSKFHAKLDDTVMNRICTAIVCDNISHSYIWNALPDQFMKSIEPRYSLLLSRIKEFDTDQKDLLKILFSLSYRFACMSGDPSGFNHLVKQMLESKNEELLIILVKSLTICLNSAHNSNKLIVIEFLTDDEVVSGLYSYFRSQQNIHRSKNLIIIFAWILLSCLHKQKSEHNLISHECIKWTETGQSIFLLAMELIKQNNIAYSISNTPFSDFKIGVNEFESLDVPKQARFLILLCKQMNLSNMNLSEWIKYLKIKDNFPKLCTTTLDLIVKSPMEIEGELYNFIVSSWCELLINSLEHSTKDVILNLINLRTQATAMRNMSFQLPIMPSLMQIVFDRLVDDSYDACFCDGKRCSCKLRLWSLLNIITVYGPEFPGLSNHWDNIFVLFKKYVNLENDMDHGKLSRLLDYTVLLSQKHWLSKSSDVISFLFKLLDYITNQPLNLTVLSTTVFALLRLFKHLNIIQIDQDFISKHVIYLFRILVKSCNFNDNIEQQMQLQKMILRFLNFEYSHQSWTKQSQMEFHKFLKTTLEVDVDTPDLIGDADFRLLVLSTMVTYLVSLCLLDDNCNNLGNECMYSWLLKSFESILTFDFSESSECVPIAQLMRENLRYLPEENLMQSNEHLNGILCLLRDKLPLTPEEILELKFISYDGKKCQACGENIEELLDDILIARTNDMIIDCSEG